MYIRGISGKWYAMWHSSPSPKYSRTSSGHWFASASSSTVRVVRVDQRAQLLDHGVRLGQVLVVGAFALDRYGMASSRKPSTPMSSQKRMTRNIALRTCGLSKLRSGWWLKKRCQ